MPPPTTAVYFNTTAPAAPPGEQNNVYQSDGGQPLQRITSYTPPATADLCGAVRPDNVGLQVDVNGVMSLIAPGTGPGGGTTPGTGGGFGPPVVPAGAKDGSNTSYTLPAPPIAGTGYLYVRDGVVQRQLGASAEYAVQGTQLSILHPLLSGDWHEFYYSQGTPNSESGGGGVVPVTPGTFIQGASGVSGANPGTYSLAFPAANGVGDCLIVDVALREGFNGSSGTITVTDTNGNTYSQVQSGETAGCAGIAFVAFNCAAGSNTVTVHGAGGAGDPYVFLLAIHEYGAFGPAAALDSAAYAFSIGGGFPITASVTTTQTLDLLHIFGFANGTATLPFTDTGGWTAREATGPDTNFGVIIGSRDAQASAAGTYSDTISAVLGSAAGVILVALKTS